MKLKDYELSGQVFGRWTAIRKTVNRFKRPSWWCECACGTERAVETRHLIRGQSKSCGCALWGNKRGHKHGHNTNNVFSPEYSSWHQMKQRCLNPNDKRYHDYGGRGIKVCERWLDFNNFFEDMGEKPTSKHSIDRIDVDGNYEPTNCKWSDDYEQQRNIRVHKNNKLGVKGVHFDKQRNKYTAQLYANGKRRYMKRFDTLEEAIEGRKQAEIKHWGKSSL